MKKLTQILTAALLSAALITGTAKAQMTSTANSMSSNGMSASPWKIGIGIEPGYATGALHPTTSMALAGSLRLQYNTGSIFSVMLTSGYDNFFLGKTTSTNTTIGSTTYATPGHSQGVIPVELGFKAFFVHHVYVSAEGGVGFETQYAENKKLILAPGLGYTYGPWDVSAVYQDFSGNNTRYGIAGLRFAYAFGL